MDTGVLSVSLNVSDIKASKEFYEKLGFETFSNYMNGEIMMKII